MRAAGSLACVLVLVATASGAAAPGVKIQAEGATVTAACAGGDARIEGNHNTIQIAGPCRALALFGAGNTVTAELVAGATVRIEGSDNSLTMIMAPGAAPPVTTVLGERDLVTSRLSAAVTAQPPSAANAPALLPPGLPPPPPASAPPVAPPVAVLTIEGDDRQVDQDCAGRAVVVRGARSRVRLRGGCRSVSVSGDTLTVVAEMLPRGTVALEGQGSTVTYTAPAASQIATRAKGAGSEILRVKSLAD